jgi:hypothetical protein
VIAVAVRWYLRYGLTYRDVEELLAERGIEVDHMTVYRWVQTFTCGFFEATARSAGTSGRRPRPPACSTSPPASSIPADDGTSRSTATGPGPATSRPRSPDYALMISIQRSPASKTFYDRKRAEGKRHNQAVLALARRRVDVMWAMLRDQRTYHERQPVFVAAA